MAGFLALTPVATAQAYYSAAPEVLAEPYIATADNTLHDIAVVFDLGYIEILAANPGVDPWTPGEGTRVQIPTRHLLPDGIRKGIIVNIGDRRAYFFKDDGEVESFPIGIGREGREIPLGRTRITLKRPNPTWTPPQSIRAEKPDLPAVVPPGPDNPLGDYALNLGFPSYLLHGTNAPDGVGRRVSAGCIRFYPWDIEHLFHQVGVGTPVEVVNQPVKLETVDGEVYMEVHLEGRQVDEFEETGLFTPQPIPDLEQLVREKAGEHADRIDWTRVMQVAEERSGLAIRITGPSDAPSDGFGGFGSGIAERRNHDLRPDPTAREPAVPSGFDYLPPLPQRAVSGNGRGPLSLTDREAGSRSVETARDVSGSREPGAGIW